MTVQILTREQWLKERQTGIGGTDAPAIMGVSSYRTNVELWQEKTGQRKPETVNNALAKYGNDSESHLIELFKLDYTQQYAVAARSTDYALWRNHEYPWMLGSLDGELTCKETGNKGVLEIKTATIMNRAHRDQWDNRIPAAHFWQVLHYLLVTGYDFVLLKAQLKSIASDGELIKTTKHYRFTRDEVSQQLERLLEAEIKFWNHVQNRTQPPRILPGI